MGRPKTCYVLDGQDLIRGFRLKPGPKIGLILKQVGQWEKEHKRHITKEMAFDYIRKNINLREYKNEPIQSGN